MVWFQCESCGENLKKPKLVNHFRGCAARKLSCIDCGVVFDQQSVQAHTSCVSETEKYGPKGGSNGAAQKPKSSQAHKDSDVDLSIGLSASSPWNCSLCNVNATSYETLESHAQGKKHRAKAKAAHAKLNSVPVVEAASNSHGNGSQPKASAETKGSEPVGDGKLLPTSEGKEGVEEGKLLPTAEGREGVEDGKLLPTSEADDVDLRIGLSKRSAGYPYTCSLCIFDAKSSVALKEHSQGRKHRAKAIAAHTMLMSKADGVGLSIGLTTLEAGFPYTCSLCKFDAKSSVALVEHSQGRKHRAKAMAAHTMLMSKADGVDLSIGLSTLEAGFPYTCSLCKFDAKSSVALKEHTQGRKHRASAMAAHENGSEPKASAETEPGSKPVEDGKLLPTSKGKEGNLKKRKAGDKREKKSGEKRTKSNEGEKLLDAAVEKGIVSSEIGGGDQLEVENSASSLAFGKSAKWRKLTAKVLENLKTPEKGIKIKELFNEILPLATSGADNFDKKAFEKQLAETLNASSKFEVRGDWVALAKTS